MNKISIILNHPLSLIIIVLLIRCTPSTDREDIKLMSMVSHDQIQVNDNLVKSLRMHLEFYGAVAGEEEYYSSSEKLWALRKSLVKKPDVEHLLSFADSVDNHLNYIKENGDDYLDRLNLFYRQKVTDDFDSLSYYKFLYTTLKKEHAFHSYNAKMMRQ